MIRTTTRLALSAALFLLSTVTRAGPVADTFRDGIFGLPWGSNAAEIEAKFPAGKWQDFKGGLRYYTIRDSRQVLGIERKRKNDISFGLSSDGRLSSVSIMFPTDGETYGSLIARCKEQFGPTEVKRDSDQENKVAPSTTFSNSWPVDEGFEVQLVNFIAMVGSGIQLTVTNTAIRPDPGDAGFK